MGKPNDALAYLHASSCITGHRRPQYLHHLRLLPGRRKGQHDEQRGGLYRVCSARCACAGMGRQYGTVQDGEHWQRSLGLQLWVSGRRYSGRSPKLCGFWEAVYHPGEPCSMAVRSECYTASLTSTYRLEPSTPRSSRR